MTDRHPEHLPSSALGTKRYWDSLYTTELANNKHDPSDRGTVWFDDSDAEARVLEYLSSTDLPREATSFLDLGCGNGSLLFALREGGVDGQHDEDDDDEARRDRWTGRMLGVDYSLPSVLLAAQIRSSKPASTSENLTFQLFDVLDSSPVDILRGAQSSGFDVALDKGTFDAISLSAEVDARGRRLNEGYGESVARFVRPGGLFVITSCNWTEQELRGWFEGRWFRWEGRVEYRSFQFGGAKGQTITTLCFKRVDS